MTKFSGLARAPRARVAGALAVVAAAVIATGFVVANSLGAPAHPAPALTLDQSPAPARLSAATFAFTAARTASRYRCSLDAASFTSCASPVTVTGLAAGGHTFSVEAVYGPGSATSRPARYTWQVVPAAPVITPGPGYLTGSPGFTFTDASWPEVAFTCWLDDGAHHGCTSAPGHPAIQGQWRSGPLAPGYHCLSAVVTDRAGHHSAVTRFCWTIAASGNFRVGGDLPSPLYPGTSQPLNLTFTNPNLAPITIPRGGISAGNITITTRAPGCASSNFAVTRGLTAAVTIPAGRTTPTSLSALGVPKASWPVIEMVDTRTNQDACQDAKLTLTYAGIEATG